MSLFNFLKKEKADKTRDNLELILQNTEPDEKVTKTVLGIYDSLSAIRNKYFKWWNPLAKREGLMVYTNYNHDSELEINGLKKAIRVSENSPVTDERGRKKLEEIQYANGAVEVDATTGDIDFYSKHIMVNPKDVALMYGLIENKKQEIPANRLGFREDLRNKKNNPKYRGIGTKHINGISATGLDNKIYVLILSRETGDITVLHDYKILGSTIEEEVHDDYKKYLFPSKTLNTEQPYQLPLCNTIYKPQSTPQLPVH